jgi:hypothetical protein
MGEAVLEHVLDADGDLILTLNNPNAAFVVWKDASNGSTSIYPRHLIAMG